MGLFVKKHQEESINFTVSAASANTIVIVGLGNPGKEYDNTRHNVGFICLDALQQAQDEFSPWQDKKTLHCQISSGTFGQTKVILVKPTTFMNNSGKAVETVLNFYKLSTKQLTVVHDELDLSYGNIRTRVGGSPAGHNGIKSITQHLGEAYGRVRIGIDSEARSNQQDSSSYVLAKFNQEEQDQIPKLKREVQSLLIELIYRGELYPDTRNFLL